MVAGIGRNTGVSPLRRAMKLHGFGRDDVLFRTGATSVEMTWIGGGSKRAAAWQGFIWPRVWEWA